MGGRPGGGHPLVATQGRESLGVAGRPERRPARGSGSQGAYLWADMRQNFLTRLGTGTRACKEAVSLTSVLRKRMGPRILISGCQIKSRQNHSVPRKRALISCEGGDRMRPRQGWQGWEWAVPHLPRPPGGSPLLPSSATLGVQVGARALGLTPVQEPSGFTVGPTSSAPGSPRPPRTPRHPRGGHHVRRLETSQCPEWPAAPCVCEGREGRSRRSQYRGLGLPETAS